MQPEFKKRLDKVMNRMSYASFGAGFCLLIQAFIFYSKPTAIVLAILAFFLTMPGLLSSLKDFPSHGKTDV